jgi:hypothetical protein
MSVFIDSDGIHTIFLDVVFQIVHLIQPFGIDT